METVSIPGFALYHTGFVLTNWLAGVDVNDEAGSLVTTQ